MEKIPEIKFEDQQINPTNIEIISFESLKRKVDSPHNHNPYKPHRLKFNAIFLIAEGKEGHHNIDFEDYPYTRGSIILLSKEQIHSFVDLPKANEGFLLLFTEDFFLEVGATYPFLVNHLYNSQLYYPIINLGDEKFKELYALVIKIKKDVSSKNKSIRSEIAKSYFKILLLELFHCRTKKNEIIEKSPYLEEFIQFQQALKTNIHKERKVKFYAQQLNVTTKQLNVITQSTINLSAKEFIISTVILEAKKYLKDPDFSSKEVAYKLGFDEPTNFTKFFKKHTQMLPSEFTTSA